MKNNKFIDSFNRIGPDDSSEKRMLDAILKKKAEKEMNEETVHSEIVNEYSVNRNGSKTNRIIRTAVPAAACIAFLIGTVKVVTGFIPARNDDSNSVSVSETGLTTVSENPNFETEPETSSISLQKKSTTSISTVETSGYTTDTTVTIINDNNTVSVSENTKKAETRQTDAPVKTEGKQALTTPEEKNTEKPKTEKVTDPQYITTTTVTESKPRQTVPAVTAAPVTKHRMSTDELIELSKKGYDLKLSDFAEFEFEDIGSGIYIYRYPIENTGYALCVFKRNMYDPDTFDRTSLDMMNSNVHNGIDIRESTPEQIREVIYGTTATETEKTKITTEFITGLSSRNAELTWNELDKYESMDYGISEDEKIFPIADTNCALYAKGRDGFYVKSAVLIFPESSYADSADVRINTPDQLRAFITGKTMHVPTENISKVVISDLNNINTIELNNSGAYYLTAILQRIITGDESYDAGQYDGHCITFDITYSDGTTHSVSVMSPFITIDGKSYISTTEQITAFTDFVGSAKDNGYVVP